MNRVFLIGNLCADPVTKTTQSGISLCTFTIAVNRRQTANAQPEADYFRVTAWRQLGELCAKYLAKGRKVSVIGSISASAYTAADGKARAALEVQADEVEFLSPKQETTAQATPAPQKAQQSGFIQVDPRDELPF